MKFITNELAQAAIVLFLCIWGINTYAMVNNTEFPLINPDSPWNQPDYKLKSIFMDKDLFKNTLEDGTDLDKLSIAVAMHETKNCGVVTNFTIKNNCHGIKLYGKPVRFPATINNQVWDNSDDYFKDLWARKYKRFPDRRLADRYSGKDRVDAWLKNVTHFYNTI